MIERLTFAAAFIYSTKGTSSISIRSRQLRDRIKGGDVLLYRQIAQHIAELVGRGEFQGFFGPEVTLVPVPGHATLARGARLKTTLIAEALAAAGLGREVSELLRRREPVTKSATAKPAERPRATDHFTSLEVTQPLVPPERVTLIDDVITRGATALGAASRLNDTFPGLQVRAFGLLRPETSGEVMAIREARVGTIEMDQAGECRRKP